MTVITDLSAQQLANAQLIHRAALPYGRAAVMGALMTAGDESSWLIYANNGRSARPDVSADAKQVAATSMNYPHDAVAGEAWTTADSVGLFQQRPMYGYGTVAALMDPADSTVIFLTGNGSTRAFMKAPAGLTLAQRCQWTQGSEFTDGANYAPFEAVATQLIERFGGTPPTGLLEDLMVDQCALDKYADQIAGRVTGAKVNDSNVADLLYNGRHYTADEVLKYKIHSRVDGKDYPLKDFLSGIDEKVAALTKAVAALTAKLK